MTFTEITKCCDQVRCRWHFDWLASDPPTWHWPQSVSTPRRNA